MLFNSEINKNEFKTTMGNIKTMLDNQSSFIHSKIDLWLNKIELSSYSLKIKEQKRKELIEAGFFIYCFNPNIEITDALCERPDISISMNNKNIGIELTDLVIRDDEKEKEGLLKKLFNQIENELKKESNEYNGIYHVGFINDISFDQKNQIRIKSEIINLIKEKIQVGNLVNRFRKSYHSDIHIYNSEGWCSGVLDRNTVAGTIKRKEEKISNYISDSFEEVWLLIIIGGARASADYSHLAEDLIKTPFKTGFGKIFILNFFKSELLELITSK